MKNTDKPLLCQGCKLKNSDNVWCAGYAFRCALNNLKSGIREPFDAIFGREPKEYNYECINYIPKE